MPPQVSELKDPAALDLLRGLQREPISVPELGRDIQTAFIEPSASAGECQPSSFSAKSHCLAFSRAVHSRAISSHLALISIMINVFAWPGVVSTLDRFAFCIVLCIA